MAGVEPHAVDHPCCHRDEDGRAARHEVPPHHERRHDAGPEQEHLPGRNRLRLRDHRLLPLQCALRLEDLRHAAQGRSRPAQPYRVPSAGRLCTGRYPLQLHIDSLQPLHDPGADGQRSPLEALDHRPAEQLLSDAALQGSRSARRRGELPARQRCPHRRGGHTVETLCRHPLHRLYRHLQEPVAAGLQQSRQIHLLSATGGRDRRQGLHLCASLCRQESRGHRRLLRCLRVSGSEVLGRLAHVHPQEPLARCAGRHQGAWRRKSRWAT